MPGTLGLCEFTGKTVPPNGLLTRFHMIVRPTLPGRSVAPITATVSGRKIASNCCRSYPRTSWAGSALLDRFMVAPFQLVSTSARRQASPGDLSAFQLLLLPQVSRLEEPAPSC